MPPKAQLDPEVLTEAMQTIIANMGTTIAAAIAGAQQPQAVPAVAAPKVDKLDRPATYDGKDKAKLFEFLGSLDMYFIHNGTSYATNPAAKVSFAGSRLDGKAKTWFMSHYQLPADARPDYLSDYELFCQELRSRFGLRDIQRHAETELEKLKMQDHHHFDQHVMLFNIWKNQITGWSDRNFYNTLFDSLAPRVKVWLGTRESALPTTFDTLVSAVEIHDDNYWAIDERVKSTKKSEAKTDKSRQNSTEPKTETGRDAPPSATPKTKSNDAKDRGKRAHSGSSPNSKTNSTTNPGANTSTSDPPAYTKHLDNDGHITQAERDRRFKEGLCLYCGIKGHNAQDCRKRLAKAAAAGTTRPNTRARATVTLSSIEEVPGNDQATQ